MRWYRRMWREEWEVFLVPFDMPVLVFIRWGFGIELTAFIVYRDVSG